MRSKFLTILTLIAGTAFGAVPQAAAQQIDSALADVSHGRALVKANCARCHAVELDGISPEVQAVPFWRMTIHRDVSTLEDDLYNRKLPKHNIMPTFALTRKQARDIASWIAWVQPRAHGKRILEANCAKCHAIGLTDKNKHPEALEFRYLSKYYPIDALQEAFAEGIETGHPDMPAFTMTELQIADVIVYLESIQEKR
ncbi:c-type cytochrome [Lentilitoribacter sp. EG35]|jgi:mono/diheme cytochrome c family protein|uniref:c-type cytochrome n=1 Tax=Lentilitoribacter sp. EG35 TaxID=3234192 RepID=UPI003460F355